MGKTFGTVFSSILLMMILVITVGDAAAQRDYLVGAGVRVGPSNGLTVKANVGEISTVETLLSSRFGGLYLTALYEINQSAFGTEALNFYYGLGAHVGFWDGDLEYRAPSTENTDPSTGFDGIIGLELTLEAIPFALSLDWKPLVHVYRNTDFWVDEVGFSVRYIIKR